MELLLSSKGHQVYTAVNGLAAFNLLQDLTILPDLILLDAQMPVMDGYQFRIEQRKNLRLRDIPVFIMSGDDDILMYQKMDYPQHVLLKPISIQTLLDCVALQ